MKYFTNKPLILGLLILIFIIPLSEISTIVLERQNNLQAVKQDIANTYTGEQTLAGPWLIVDYKLEGEDSSWKYFDTRPKVEIKTPWQKQYRAWQRPLNLALQSNLDVSSKSRGIYEVPVYLSHNHLDANFNIDPLFTSMKKANAKLSMEHAFIAFELSDQRGLQAPPIVQMMGKTVEAKPGLPYAGAKDGFYFPVPLQTLKSSKSIEASIDFKLRGTNAIELSPSGNENQLTVLANWPHPKFTGAYLPDNSEISDHDTSASWSISSFATGLEMKPFIGKPSVIPDWQSPGVARMEIFEPVNIYTLNLRATKYGMLFVILSFAGFYMFELIQKQNLHPIQYGLIGLALSVFFLLLLSSSEVLGFTLAYSLATLSCIGLISFYIAGKIGRHAALRLSALLLTLYSSVFIILRLEDRALLVGSVLIFIVLASVMIITRKMDWYVLSSSAKNSLAKTANY